MMKRIFQLTIAVGIMVFLMPGKMFATDHIVHFGDYFFSPDSFSAHVGDTVTWQGNFSMHNTVSESIPAGAAAWNHGLTSGTTDTAFSYVIKVAGTYHYECTVHVSLGMVGVFTVAATSGTRSSSLPPDGVNSIAVHALSLPGGGATLLFNLPRAEVVSYKIVNVAGRQLLAGDNRQFEAGVTAIHLATIPNGAYLVRVIANGAAVTNTFSILR
jgi:plastocyanin